LDKEIDQLGDTRLQQEWLCGLCIGNALILIQHSVPTRLVTIIKKTSLHGIGELGVVLNDIEEVSKPTEEKRKK
jgi:hypothetical protein